MNKKIKVTYVFIASLVLAIMTMGGTYAYLAATAYSAVNDVNTDSKTYSISMEITPIEEYTGFSFIPMNDEDVIKALNNKCKDKYDRGACSAYNIKVFGYSNELDYISGYLDISTENMENISYLTLEEKTLSPEATEEEIATCAEINEKNYCIKQPATSMGNGKELPLGESYSVLGLQEKNIILVMWLTNLNKNQNTTDIGDFNTTVTILAGNGGEIKGTIASSIQVNDPDNNPDNP